MLNMAFYQKPSPACCQCRQPQILGRGSVPDTNISSLIYMNQIPNKKQINHFQPVMFQLVHGNILVESLSVVWLGLISYC